MSADLSYVDRGLFTVFVPNTKAGEKAWCEIAHENDGCANILSIHAGEVVAQLRRAGYSVVKHRPVKLDDDALLAELGL